MGLGKVKGCRAGRFPASELPRGLSKTQIPHLAPGISGVEPRASVSLMSTHLDAAAAGGGLGLPCREPVVGRPWKWRTGGRVRAGAGLVVN